MCHCSSALLRVPAQREQGDKGSVTGTHLDARNALFFLPLAVALLPEVTDLLGLLVELLTFGFPILFQS